MQGNRIKFIGLAVSAVIVFSCDTYEFPKSPFARVETLPVAKISSEGVIFQGQLIYQGSRPILEHGFVWGESDKLSVNIDNKFQIRGDAQVGPLTAEVKTGFVAGETYIAKAYVIAEGYVTYGSGVKFTSLGSAAPVIKSFTPVEANWGDTVTIHGKNFGTSLRHITVKFSTFDALLLSNNDSTIRCLVPTDLSAPSAPIAVSVLKNQTQSLINFQLTVPVIDQFNPGEATFGDVITISGRNFGATPETNLVKFDELYADIIQASKTTLKVRVPADLQRRESFIRVSVNNQTTQASRGFTLAPPVILSLSKTEAFTNESILILGENFSPIENRNEVFIDDINVSVEAVTPTLIKCSLPVGPFKSRALTVKVTVAQQTATSTQTITLLDPWLQKNNLPNGQQGQLNAVAFSLGDKGYVVETQSDEGNTWQYDPVLDRWENVAQLLATPATAAVSFQAGNKGYVCLSPSNACWAYDPVSKAWSPRSGLPDSVRIHLGFSASGYGYVLAINETANFWRYDPGIDRWSLLADRPFIFGEWPDTGFVAGGGLFVLYGSSSGYKVFGFNFATGTWDQKTAPDGPYEPGSPSFAYNEAGYVHGYSHVNKYNPATDTWQAKLIGVPRGVQSALVFQVKEKVYLVNYGELWEFDPAFEF